MAAISAMVVATTVANDRDQQRGLQRVDKGRVVQGRAIPFEREFRPDASNAVLVEGIKDHDGKGRIEIDEEGKAQHTKAGITFDIMPLFHAATSFLRARSAISTRTIITKIISMTAMAEPKGQLRPPPNCS